MAQNDLNATGLMNLSHILGDMKQSPIDDGEDDDWSRETLQQTRYIIQRIIVPCVVTIGIAKNLLTVIVLTRRRMRCSTNIYLTALASADIVNLFCAFILSLQHYPGFKYGHVLYWSAFGLSNWFHDASLVMILCFLCTVTTNFEYELRCSTVGYDFAKNERCFPKLIDDSTLCALNSFDATCEMVGFDVSTSKPCTLNQSNPSASCQMVHSYSVRQSDFSRSDSYQNFFYYPSTFFGTLLPFELLSILNGFLIWTVRKSHKMRHTMTNTRQDTSQENKVTITLIAVVILFFVCQTPNALQLLHIIHLNFHSNRNLVYNNIFNLLITVNAASNFILYCLLSDKYRKTVKQLFCGVRVIRRNTMSSSRFTSGRTTTSSFYSRSRNSNFFNMPIYKQRGPRFSITKEEYANLQAETAKRNRFSITTLTSQSRNNSVGDAENAEEIQLKPTVNAGKSSKQEKNRIKNIRFSFAPSNTSLKHKTKEEPATTVNVEQINEQKPDLDEQPETTSPESETPVVTHESMNTACTHLRPSPSDTSLTRSRSLEFPTKPKHSPDCKDNPYKL